MVEFKVLKLDDSRIIKNLSGDYNFKEFMRIVQENRNLLQMRSEQQRGEDLHNTLGALQLIRSLCDMVDNIDTIINESSDRKRNVAAKVKAAIDINS